MTFRTPSTEKEMHHWLDSGSQWHWISVNNEFTLINSGQNANPHSQRRSKLISFVCNSHRLNIIKNVFSVLLPVINDITCWRLPVVTFPAVWTLTEGRSTAMFAFLSCETTHWCFKVPRTEVSTIPLRNCSRIRGKDSQSLRTIASFHASFSSLHPQKMEAVDGATGRPLSLICPVKSAGAAKAQFAGALQTRWSCQIIPSFPPLRQPTETIPWAD